MRCMEQLLMKMRMEAKLNDMLSNQFKNAEEYAYHLEQATNFMENQILHTKLFPKADLEEKMNRWVRKEFKNSNKDARLSIQHWKDSWHKRVYKQNQKRVRDNPKDYFSNHRITEVIRITTDQQHGLDFMEEIIRVHDFWLGIESYQIKVNLTAPTLTFPGIEEYEPYSIVDKPTTGLIYLNSKDEKRVMYLVEIVKFCDGRWKRS
ncbi:hypothetical protein Tco_0644235 [Tanacetum coccineum]